MIDPQQPGGQPPYGNQPPYGGQNPYGSPSAPPPQGAYRTQPMMDSSQSPGYGSPPVSSAQGNAGFFAALFDFSFNTFVTPKIVKFVYVLATIMLALMLLFIVGAAFADSAGFGVLMLIVGPVIFLVYLAFIRMALEFGFALVRMSDDIHHRLPPR